MHITTHNEAGHSDRRRAVSKDASHRNTHMLSLKNQPVLWLVMVVMSMSLTLGCARLITPSDQDRRMMAYPEMKDVSRLIALATRSEDPADRLLACSSTASLIKRTKVSLEPLNELRDAFTQFEPDCRDKLKEIYAPWQPETFDWLAKLVKNESISQQDRFKVLYAFLGIAQKRLKNVPDTRKKEILNGLDRVSRAAPASLVEAVVTNTQKTACDYHDFLLLRTLLATSRGNARLQELATKGLTECAGRSNREKFAQQFVFYADFWSGIPALKTAFEAMSKDRQGGRVLSKLLPLTHNKTRYSSLDRIWRIASSMLVKHHPGVAIQHHKWLHVSDLQEALNRFQCSAQWSNEFLKAALYATNRSATIRARACFMQHVDVDSAVDFLATPNRDRTLAKRLVKNIKPWVKGSSGRQTLLKRLGDVRNEDLRPIVNQLIKQDPSILSSLIKNLPRQDYHDALKVLIIELGGTKISRSEFSLVWKSLVESYASTSLKRKLLTARLKAVPGERATLCEALTDTNTEIQDHVMKMIKRQLAKGSINSWERSCSAVSDLASARLAVKVIENMPNVINFETALRWVELSLHMSDDDSGAFDTSAQAAAMDEEHQRTLMRRLATIARSSSTKAHKLLPLLEAKDEKETDVSGDNETRTELQHELLKAILLPPIDRNVAKVLSLLLEKRKASDAVRKQLATGLANIKDRTVQESLRAYEEGIRRKVLNAKIKEISEFDPLSESRRIALRRLRDTYKETADRPMIEKLYKEWLKEVLEQDLNVLTSEEWIEFLQEFDTYGVTVPKTYARAIVEAYVDAAETAEDLDNTKASSEYLFQAVAWLKKISPKEARKLKAKADKLKAKADRIAMWRYSKHIAHVGWKAYFLMRPKCDFGDEIDVAKCKKSKQKTIKRFKKELLGKEMYFRLPPLKAVTTRFDKHRGKYSVTVGDNGCLLGRCGRHQTFGVKGSYRVLKYDSGRLGNKWRKEHMGVVLNFPKMRNGEIIMSPAVIQSRKMTIDEAARSPLRVMGKARMKNEAAGKEGIAELLVRIKGLRTYKPGWSHSNSDEPTHYIIDVDVVGRRLSFFSPGDSDDLFGDDSIEQQDESWRREAQQVIEW